ncbi:hypothetical protein B0H14DRAFT_3017334 [Mycena olivaceomarginata]|nr:hypothetical protein B0H14DRAFT_3017334 [Mycena olivaceomarginata]
MPKWACKATRIISTRSADLNPTAYLTSICNLPPVQNDKVLDTRVTVLFEWGLPVQFETTDDFLRDWADARKLAYSQCAGWIIEESERAGDMAREWYKLKTRSLRSHADVFASGL